MAVVAVLTGLIGVHVTAFSLDETLIRQSAVHYTSNLPHSLLHDLNARATNRLYSLVLSVAFRVFGTVDAVRFDHALNSALFVSTAIPVYKLGVVVIRSRWYAAAAALLSVVVPWLTLTTALYTENLAYPLVWWMLFATHLAVWRPSIVRDAVAVVTVLLLIGTRVQFAAILVGYLGASLSVVVWRAQGMSWPRRLRRAAVIFPRQYPVSCAIAAAGIAFLIYESASGHLQHDELALLGSYSNVVQGRPGVPADISLALLAEFVSLALGVGLLPAVVAVIWYGKSLSRPELTQRWLFLLSAGLIILVILGSTVYAQDGYLGAITEERYYFYVVPVFWLGTFAALRDLTVRPGEIVACTVAVAALYGAVPFLDSLNQETAFLAPVGAAVPHIIQQRLVQVHISGVTVRDALAFLALVSGLLTALIWRVRPRLRLMWTVGAAAAVQLILSGYAFAVVDGKVHNIPGRTGGSATALGWVDEHARSPSVAWLNNVPTSAPVTNADGTDDQQRTTLFWNGRLSSWIDVAELGLPSVEVPLASLPGLELAVDPKSGALSPGGSTTGIREVVGAAGSPFLQLAGAGIGHSPDGVLTLTEVDQPARVLWLASGLGSDGSIGSATKAQLLASRPGPPGSYAGVITLTFQAPASGPSKPLPAATGSRTASHYAPTRQGVRLTLGPITTSVPLTPGTGVHRVLALACFRPDRTVVLGSLTALDPGAPSSQLQGTLVSAAVVPATTRQLRLCLSRRDRPLQPF